MEHMTKRNMTIHDVARELGVSPSTVSRAISGKGRIGSATREKILSFIQENDYHPSAAAQSLAQSKTYNIALVLPEIKTLAEMPFFQTCMYAVGEMAQLNNYDMIVVNGNGTDTTSLERLIMNKKVDGVILSRTYRKDVYSKLLAEKGIPFVAIGQLEDGRGIQIDHDHREACKELTSILLAKGNSRIAYLGASMEQMVNRIRYEGYVAAIQEAKGDVDHSLIYRNLDTRKQIELAVETILSRDTVDCILCQDDVICDVVVHKLAEKKIKVPGKMHVASCHYSRLLESYPVGITSLKFNVEDLGKNACKMLLNMIDGSAVPSRMLLDYEVRLKESTK